MNRALFPALRRTVNGFPAAYLDAPGGTQLPETVINAMAEAARRGLCNTGGYFPPSAEAEEIVSAARLAAADLLGCTPREVVFGQNMTSLTYAVSRTLSRSWEPGSNIVLSRSDHDGNVTPWIQAAEDRGVQVRWLDIDPRDGCRHDLSRLHQVLDERTRLVAATLASNATGTLTDVKGIVDGAHAAGALTYLDAVHFAPHRLVDVREIGSSFLVCSAYKFFGPHVGLLYGDERILDSHAHFRLRPTPAIGPEAWEPGTQPYAHLAGITAAVDYIASLGAGHSRRARLVDAFGRIGEHEAALASRFLSRLGDADGFRIVGVHGVDGRTPTFALDIKRVSPHAVARKLGDQGIFVWSGHFYAWELVHRLGLDKKGLLRVGAVHYNSEEEVDRFADALVQCLHSG